MWTQGVCFLRQTQAFFPSAPKYKMLGKRDKVWLGIWRKVRQAKDSFQVCLHTYDYNCTMYVHAFLCISVGGNLKVHMAQIYVIVQEMGAFRCVGRCVAMYMRWLSHALVLCLCVLVWGVSVVLPHLTRMIDSVCMKCGHAFINLSIGIYFLVSDNSFFKKKGRFHSLGLLLFEELRSRVSSAFRLGYMDPWNGVESCLKTGLCSIPEPASWARTLYPRWEQSQESNQRSGTCST